MDFYELCEDCAVQAVMTEWLDAIERDEQRRRARAVWVGIASLLLVIGAAWVLGLVP